MASNKPPARHISGIRGRIPFGYLLGRASAGEGDVELISMGKAQSVGLIPNKLPPSGPAGGDLGGTYPKPTVVGLQSNAVASGVPTNKQVLMWITAGAHWIAQTIGLIPVAGTTGQVLTKNSSTDFDMSWQTPSASGGGATSIQDDGTNVVVAISDGDGQLVLDGAGDPIFVPEVFPYAAMPAALAFQAKLTADQSVTSGTPVLCKPDTFVTNTLGTQYNPSTGKFTPTRAGTYVVFVTVQGKATSPDTITQVNGNAFKNGGAGVGIQICSGQTGPDDAGTIFSFPSFGMGVVAMNGTTDTLELSARVDATGANPLVILGVGNTTFGAFYLGP